MAILKVSEDQLEVILDALSMAARRCQELTDCIDDRSIKKATRIVASQYGELRQELKDGKLNAEVTVGAS